MNKNENITLIDQNGNEICAGSLVLAIRDFYAPRWADRYLDASIGLRTVSSKAVLLVTDIAPSEHPAVVTVFLIDVKSNNKYELFTVATKVPECVQVIS